VSVREIDRIATLKSIDRNFNGHIPRGSELAGARMFPL